jgi:hypothetical protein
LKAQKTAKSKDNIEKRGNSADISIIDFKLYYRAIAIKIV